MSMQTAIWTRNRGVLIGAACFLACAGSVEAQTIRGLGFLPGHTQSVGAGISDDGLVVCGFSFAGPTIANASVAFRWTEAGGRTSLGTLGGPDSRAFAISGDGSTITGWSSMVFPSGPQKVFRWTAGTGLQNLGALNGDQAQAYCVSADGSVIAGFSWPTSGGTMAFRWTAAGGMEGIGTLGGIRSAVSGMNPDGNVLVGGSTLTNTAVTHGRAFRWTRDGGMQDLGVLNSTDSHAVAVSADGSIIAGVNTLYSPQGSLVSQSVFRWTQSGGMVNLGSGGNTYASVSGMSADGSILVGEAGSRAYLWRADIGIVNLNQYLAAANVDMSHWLLTRANGITADGRTVVGEGQHDGVLEGYVVTLPLSGPNAPGAFALTAPTAGGVTGSLAPVLTWEPSANATSYAISITPNGNSAIALTSTGTSVTVPAGVLANCQSATWSVVASGPGGSVMSTPVAQSFSLSSRADFDRDGVSTVSDIFAFLAAWFAGNPQADFNHQGGITVSDIFNFLDTWFAGCA